MTVYGVVHGERKVDKDGSEHIVTGSIDDLVKVWKW